MAKKVQLMTNPKQWQVIDGVEVLIDVPQEDIDPMTDSSCVEIEGHRTLEETINEDNAFSPEIIETKVSSKVGGVYHDNVMNGAYEEAILYGNTQVNLVESITSGTKYIPHSFTSFQGNESKIGNYHSDRTNQVAPLVKGVTMVNLVQEGSMTLEGGTALIVHNVKGNTKYTLKFTFTQKNNMAGIVIQSYKDENGTLTYLENSKLQSGLGDEVAITFTTHEQANRVHICNGNEYGGETIQLDNIMLIEGDVTDLDLPFFKGMRSVELSRPLTNLFTDDLVHYNQNTSSTNTDGDIAVTSISVSSWNNTDYYLKNLKPHTKYIVMWDGLTTTQTATTQQEILVCAVCVQGNVKLGGINEDVKCPTLRSMIFDTRDKDLSQIVLRIHASMSNSEATSTTIKGLRVFEWDDSLRSVDLQSLGYFSGTKHISTKAIETVGKNLYPYGDINFTNDYVGWCDAKGKTNMYGDIAQKSSCRFLLKKGTYTFSFGETINTTYLTLVDDKEQRHGGSASGEKTFTLAQDTYMTLRLKTTEANVATTVTNIQIERGETATTYEAYHSRYYKPRETEEIILRSLPNGVCDTFNLQTGELVQKLWCATYDGDSSKYSVFAIDNTISQNTDYVVNNTSAYFKLQQSVVGSGKVVGYEEIPNMVCNTLKVCSRMDCQQTTTNSICVYNEGEIGVRIEGVITVEQLKTYLNQNPITFQFETREPIITTIQTYDRVYNGQTNGLVNMGNNLSALTYISNNSYLKVANLSPVPAILEPITSIPYDVRLKPSTLYTIKYNRGGNSNSMNFDLGGSVVEKTNAITDLTGIAEEFTVRTPVILSHEQLILSGTGFAHNFIVVEGDITGTELPYFEGMKDVKMPIIKNIGKNLFDGELIVDKGINQGTGVYHDSEDWVTTKNLIPITKGEKISITIDANDEDITSNRRYVYIYKYDMNGNFIANDRYDLGLNAKTFAMNHYGYIRCTIRTHNVKNITITETDTPQPCIDYRVNSIYAVQGEYPITSEMMEQGGMGYSTTDSRSFDECKIDSNTRIRSKECIPIKQDYVYQLYCTGASFQTYFFDATKTSIGFTHGWNTKSLTFTTPTNAKYMSLMFKNDGELSVNAFMQKLTIHMYELDSTINLRSLPNGVKDELNLLTGEYIQRVGEVVLDGSDDEDWLHLEFSGASTVNGIADTYICYGLLLKDKGRLTGNMSYGAERHVIDTLNISSVYGDTCNQADILTEMVCVHQNGRFYLRLRKDRFASTDLVGWKLWFSQNPLTVQYELAEPITSHVRLVSNNQEREVGVKLPNGVCNTYNPSTGITTVRVGKVVLDGSENWEVAGEKPFMYILLQARSIYHVCDKLPAMANVVSTSTDLGTVILNPNNSGCLLRVRTKEILNGQSIADFKTYLASNPITVWYELKYPQIQPDIVLPNGVHDEYNPETGVYTKKVGTTILDGSENWYYDEVQFYTLKSEYSDSEKAFNSNGVTMPNTRGYNIVSGNNYQFFIEHTKLPTSGLTTSDLWKNYLAQNPTQIWYELATPITYQLTPYFGLPTPYAYEDGYLVHDSAYAETTLPPEFKYKLVTNRTGQIIQNNIKLKQHTTRLSNLEALIIEATIQSLFDRELQTFELELMDIDLIDLGE